MLELYLDSVNIEQIARLHACLPLRGVTTNPSILANAGIGLQRALPALAEVLGTDARFHVQVVSASVAAMVEEAQRIDALPYDTVVKVPATEWGLAAIKQMKAAGIKVLATAIYSAQQGFLAALCGADYLAPYVNRIDSIGADGVAVVADLQVLLERHGLECKVLPASFKNTRQVLDVLKLGVGAITLPVDMAAMMFAHPAVQPAVERFAHDWQSVFGNKLSYESL
ncbi:MAG: transaldolase family protein [Gammaproteobacteria bacterium]